MEENKLTREQDGDSPPPTHLVGHDERGFIRLNLLTKRASECDKCELCNNVGLLVCDKCRVTYYCDVYHFMMDKAFHASLCSRIKALRRPIEFHPLAETRERWAKQRRLRMEEIYTHTLTQAQAYLETGKYNFAIPSATVSSKYAAKLYGEGEEMISPLMIAAESYLRLNKLSVADGYLARGLTIEATKLNIRPLYKAKIRHNEGLMALARGNWAESQYRFAEEIYETTEEYNPEHVKTSCGYCYLGHTFHLMQKYSVSSSLFRQTVEIWLRRLEPIFQEMTEDQSYLPQVPGVKSEGKVWLDEPEKFDGLSLLTRCYDEQNECVVHARPSPVSNLDLTKTCLALSILHFICGRYSESESLVAQGREHVKEGNLHALEVSKTLNEVFKHSRRRSYQLEKMMKTSLGSDSAGVTNLSTPQPDTVDMDDQEEGLLERSAKDSENSSTNNKS